MTKSATAPQSTNTITQGHIIDHIHPNREPSLHLQSTLKRYAPKKGDDNTYMIEPFLSEMPRINVSMISMMSVSTTRRLQSRVHQCLHVLSKKRSFASINRNYIDEWQRSILKSPEFYEENAAPGLKRKNYFYNIDLQGRIFLEETLPKNIATSIKNVAFLDFFLQRLQRVGPKQQKVLKRLGCENDYPFCSPCGLELNFVRPADLPIVFHGMQHDDDNQKLLVYGGSLVQPFSPDKLAISQTTGRLYHELVSDKRHQDESNTGSTLDGRSTPLHASSQLQYGLIKSSVAVSLSESIMTTGDNNHEENEDFSGMHFRCSSTNATFPIKWLPSRAQPGPSAMPFIDGVE